MRDKQMTPIILALAGFAAIVIGVYQGLVHVAPGYEGTIMSGWGGKLNHTERLLAGLGAVGVGGTVAASRWKHLAVVPAAIGGVVLFFGVRAILQKIRNLPLYTEVTTYGGNRVVFILGVEPFLLIAGGFLLVGAGIVEWRRHTGREVDGEMSPPSSSAT